MKKSSETTIEKSSGNIYKDLGMKNPDELLAKAELASAILTIINEKKWNQKQAAEALELTQPKISLLKSGQFRGFSIEKLMKLLNKLNRDIEIVIHTKKKSRSKPGHIFVKYAAA